MLWPVDSTVLGFSKFVLSSASAAIDNACWRVYTLCFCFAAGAVVVVVVVVLVAHAVLLDQVICSACAEQGNKGDKPAG